MKQIKVAVKKRSDHTEDDQLSEQDEVLKAVLERLMKKGLNPMQMSQKLVEHEEPAPDGQVWSYDLVVSECKRFKIIH